MAGDELRTADDALEPVRGVVVAEVGEGSALAKAGIQPGDVLLEWRRLPSPPANPEEARGMLESVFDWTWLAVEQASRGTVEVTGRRGEVHRVFIVAPGLWDAEVQPWLFAEIEKGRNANPALLDEEWHSRCWERFRLGEIRSQDQEWVEANTAYRAALEEAKTPFAESEIWRAIGKLHAKRDEIEEAQAAFTRALDVLEKAWGNETMALAWVLNDMADLMWLHRDLKRTESYLINALQIQKRLAPGSLYVAQTLNNLGALALQRGDLDSAEDLCGNALKIRKELIPGTLAVATTLNNLGYVAKQRGDLARAWEFYQESLIIFQDLVPDSIKIAVVLSNMSAIAIQRGELDRAAELQRRSMQIRQARSGEDLSLALALNNMGVLAQERGHLDVAMSFHMRALEIQRRIAPKSLDTAITLNNIGTLALERKDYRRAEDYLSRALAINRDVAPESIQVADNLANLADVNERLGNLEQAIYLHQRSLNLRGALSTESPKSVRTLNKIVSIAMKKGDLDEAADVCRRSLEILEESFPDSLDLADTLRNMGLIAMRRGDPNQASELLVRALQIQKKLAPDHYGTAETYHHLGVLYRRSAPEKLALAGEHFSNALDILDQQLVRLGGSYDVRSVYRAQYQNFYRDAIDLQLDLHQWNAAFQTLERSRARSFLEILSERDTVFDMDIPSDLDRKRRSLAVQIDRTQHQLKDLNPLNDRNKIDELRDELRRLSDEAGDVAERIRNISPKLASLKYPEPISVDEARQVLDPGTLLLSYSVGAESTILFSVAREKTVQVERIDIPEKELRDQILDFRNMIRHGGAPDSQRRQRLDELGRYLFNALVGPTESRLDASRRILILADGPLHLLPWAALVRSVADGNETYLVESKPIHMALSATVYGELREHRRGNGEVPASTRVAAFGDPVYPGNRKNAARHSDIAVRSAGERLLFDWEPIPYTHREVTGIASVYPGQQVRTFLGHEATEERVKSLAKDFDILHFATHGYVDADFPLLSFLALTIPEEYREGSDNGLLQAWEIFERLRIDADLVVLSACETALGEERGGEGLVGLTRAFQYAGARTVAASLWRVADLATAELMTRFYRHLRAGKTKDEALRAAQLELLRGPIRVKNERGEYEEIDAAAPYYWAAFQLYGDWQ